VRRQQLLAEVITGLMRKGLLDRSLRDIAADVGTSHRMLIHHFGSRHGLMTAIVEAIEEDQKAFMEALEGEPGGIITAMWQRLRDPELWPAERLFFECYVRALYGEAPFDRLLPGSVDDWVERTVALNSLPDVPPALARAQARLGLAVFRGLLLDLVGTGDQRGVDAAFEAYAALIAEAPEQPAAGHDPTRESRDAPTHGRDSGDDVTSSTG
jgi:AcrR family transcriptional regulator